MLPAHAKVNLSLRVLGRRPDGQHDLVTRFQALAAHDLLLGRRADRTTLEGGVADDLVLRAHHALEEQVGRALPVRFRLVKRIPMGAGLGGGSSDAATALRLVAALHDLDVDVAPLAAALGADVPFFLRGGAMEGAGRGELLTPASPAEGWFAVAWPGFGVATGAVYQAWDEVGGEGANELERAACRVEPRLARFAAALRQRDPGWRLSGSGSAYFCQTRTRGAAERAVRAIQGVGCAWTVVTRPVGPWA